MKKILLFSLLALATASASAQNYRQYGSESRYPVYVQQYEGGGEVCRDVPVQQAYNIGGVVIGSVIGYQLGREFDRSRHHRGYGYHPGRGGYYSDHRRGYRHDAYTGRGGRYSGAIVGGVIGGNAGHGYGYRRVCDSAPGYTREVLTGYRVVTRYEDGTTREHFEPIR